MSRIVLDADDERFFTPGSLINGRILTTRQLKLTSLGLYFTGSLWVDAPWIGSTWVGSVGRREVTFISLVEPIFSGQRTFPVGHEWPFSIRVPGQVDWTAVDNSLDLGITHVASIPTSLPPSFSGLGSVSVKYALGVRGSIFNTSSLMADRWASSNPASPLCEVRLRSSRELERPDLREVEIVEHFCPQSYKFDERGGSESTLVRRMSDSFNGRQPPSFQFDLHFTVPQACIAGQKIALKVLLLADEKVSSGAWAPLVYLSNLQMMIESSTRIKGPARGQKAGIVPQDDRDTVHIMDDHLVSHNKPMYLRPGVEVDLRDVISNMGPWPGEVPSFTTYGIQHRFSLRISGAVSVAGTNWRFQLKKHDLTILSPIYEPTPGYEPADYAEVPPDDEAPPTYHEAVS